ncbi:unnamed protein product [Somion occarium]|uniref:Rhodanese domain-containing protein n=1 Tax=Somion occarium TaxID=3059160 RepID=A0ABP1D643_9APHY
MLDPSAELEPSHSYDPSQPHDPSHSYNQSLSYESLRTHPRSHSHSHAFSDAQSSTSSTTLSYGEVVPRSRMSLAIPNSPSPTHSHLQSPSFLSQKRNSGSGFSSNEPQGMGSREGSGSGVHSLPNPYDAYRVSQTDSSSSHVLSQKRKQDSEEAARTSSRPNNGQVGVTSQGQFQDTLPQRTLDDVRDQVAQSIAIRAVRKAEEVDGSKVGVVLTLASVQASSSAPNTSSGLTDENGVRFLRLISSKIKRSLLTSSYIYIIGTSGLSTPGTPSPILILSSSPEFVHRATILINAKFVGRLRPLHPVLNHDPSGKRYLAEIQDLGQSTFDEEALWDVVRKSARNLIDPLVPAPDSLGIRQLLTVARAKLQRITPLEAYTELQAPDSPWPVILVDIRPQEQRNKEGEIPGALLIERNVLEWRFDPRGKVGDGEDGGRLPIADRFDLRVIVFCQEGYTSSLAAASLHDLGLLNATDIVGGLKAWREAGLPVSLPQP